MDVRVEKITLVQAGRAMCVINPQDFIVIVIRAVVNSRRSCA